MNQAIPIPATMSKSFALVLNLSDWTNAIISNDKMTLKPRIIPRFFHGKSLLKGILVSCELFLNCTYTMIPMEKNVAKAGPVMPIQ